MCAVERAYLERRLKQCLALADKATNPDVATVHREFALHYERELEAVARQAVNRLLVLG